MGFFNNLVRGVAGCSTAGHSPDTRRVRIRQGDFRTVCKHCGQPLLRYGAGDWRTDTDPPHEDA